MYSFLLLEKLKGGVCLYLQIVPTARSPASFVFRFFWLMHNRPSSQVNLKLELAGSPSRNMHYASAAAGNVHSRTETGSAF